RDLVDPFVVDLRHREVVEGVPERNEVVDIVVVVTLDNDVHYSVEDCALLHGGLRGGRGDVVVDLLRHPLEAVHVEDLLADLLLVVFDAPVGVDFLRPEVVHDRHGALAEDVLLEDVRQARLRIDREQQDALALAREPKRGRGGQGRLPEPALAPEHDVSSVRLTLEYHSERRADRAHPRTSVTSRSRSIRRFHPAIWGVTYGRSLSE